MFARADHALRKIHGSKCFVALFRPSGHFVQRLGVITSHRQLLLTTRIDDQSIRPCTGITISGIVRSSVAIQIEPEREPRASRSGESATSMRNVELEPRGAFVSRRAGTFVRNDATLNSPARFLTRMVCRSRSRTPGA